jgi:hypothetical protein
MTQRAGRASAAAGKRKAAAETAAAKRIGLIAFY